MIKLKNILEDFSDAAFHGFKMKPQQMKTSTCSTEWTSDSQDTGCPQFSDSSTISNDDLDKAVSYLNKEKIGTLIAYSRGGAVLLQALKKGATKPGNVVLVAPAWMRQWPSEKLSGSEVSGISGIIIHGAADNIVPLKHSVILSKASGLPLHVHDGLNHISILKQKGSGGGGIVIKDLDAAINALPDWGPSGEAKPEQLKQQIDFVNSLKGNKTESIKLMSVIRSIRILR